MKLDWRFYFLSLWLLIVLISLWIFIYFSDGFLIIISPLIIFVEYVLTGAFIALICNDSELAITWLYEIIKT
jgi:hypothetical protein